MITVSRLTKLFYRRRSWFKASGEPFTAVKDASFSIDQGEVVGILGPNGAGKTTIIQMLLDVLTPTSGSITYFGKELARNRTDILQQVAFGSAYTNLPGRLTIRENLTIFGTLYGLSGPLLQRRIDEYSTLFGINEILHKETGSLSAGQQTRVMLAKTFLVHPKIIILDEPTASLDPDIAHDVRDLIIKEQKERNLTVIIASHNMDEVAEICNRVIVLSKGSIIADDTPLMLARSVAQARVHLVVSDGLQRLAAWLDAQELTYEIRDRLIEITLDEKEIATLLAACAKLEVPYSSITIQKPTLEDYFLAIARKTKVSP